MSFKEKYLKYKAKYLALKNKISKNYTGGLSKEEVMEKAIETYCNDSWNYYGYENPTDCIEGETEAKKDPTKLRRINRNQPNQQKNLMKNQRKMTLKNIVKYMLILVMIMMIIILVIIIIAYITMRN